MNLYVNNQIKQHSKAIKAIIKHNDVIFTASKDGKFGSTDLKSIQFSEILNAGEELVSSVLCSDSVIVGAANGVIIKLGFDDSVEQLSIKMPGRPAAMAVSGNIMYIGDWEGNLISYDLTSKVSNKVSFGSFQFDNRQVPNGVYALSRGKQNSLLVGTSSGEVYCYEENLTKLLFQFQLHSKAVRSIGYCGVRNDQNQFISSGNDGKVYYCFSSDGTTSFKKLEINTVFEDQEYIFSCQPLKLNGQRFIAYGGTNIFLTFLNIENLLNADEKTLLATTMNQTGCEVSTFPIFNDIWSITSINEQQIAVGQESGSVLLIGTNNMNPAIHSEYISLFTEHHTISPDKFVGGNQNILPVKYLKEKYQIEKVESKNLVSIHFSPSKSKYLISMQFNQQQITYGSLTLVTPPQVQDPQGREWDLCFDVQADQTGKAYKLYMNIGEDAYVVGRRFLSQSGLLLHDATDEVDQIQQIRDYVDKVAPKVAMYQQYFADNTQLFSPKVAAEVLDSRYAAAASRSNLGLNSKKQQQLRNPNLREFTETSMAQKLAGEVGKKDLRAYIFVQPQEVKEDIVQKAFAKNLQQKFPGIELSDVLQILEPATANYADYDDIALAAVFCLMCFSLQTEEMKISKFDQDFTTLVFNKTIDSQEKAMKIFGFRLLCYIADNTVYQLIKDRKSTFVGLIPLFNESDVQCLIVMLSQFGLDDLLTPNQIQQTIGGLIGQLK